MKLGELLEALPECRVRGRRDVEIAGVTLDSRTVRQGYLFVALRGQRHDGHSYIAEAMERGAVAVLSEKDLPNNNRLTSVVAGDARSALARLSDRFYGGPSKEIEVIGVTGTNGKTTVCYLVREILSAAGRRPALLGTIEYLIGHRSVPAERTTPEAPLLQAMMREAVNEGCDSVVMEVSSHALEQHRVECVDFKVAVFTNLGRDHLDFHGSAENYFAAKSALFRSPGLRAAVVNRDDPVGERIAVSATATLLTYGLGDRATVRGSALEAGPRGSRFELHAGAGSRDVALPLLGRHNVYNALAAAAAALADGVGLETIAAALGAARPAPGRLEEVSAGGPFTVYIDYAHTADALENALLTVRERCTGRVILVFGCGGDRDRTKRTPMGRVAARLADLSIITSDNPRRENPRDIMAEIAAGFGDAADRVVEIQDRREAIAEALRRAKAGDVVLVAGKGHERTQEYADTVVPFSDKDVIAGLMNTRGS
jgi:UDP-N-acetylmuramoyl-L-alanyl-D-glutamate--2,6-diaminopimelate ligase